MPHPPVPEAQLLYVPGASLLNGHVEPGVQSHSLLTGAQQLSPSLYPLYAPAIHAGVASPAHDSPVAVYRALNTLRRLSPLHPHAEAPE